MISTVRFDQEDWVGYWLTNKAYLNFPEVVFASKRKTITTFRINKWSRDWHLSWESR